MNIYFAQVEKRSNLFSYLLAAFAISTILMLILSFSNYFEDHWDIPSTSSQAISVESRNLPVAIPIPVPPADQVQISVTPLPRSANPVPQVVPVPVHSVQ
jgi:hypothetical protein